MIMFRSINKVRKILNKFGSKTNSTYLWKLFFEKHAGSKNHRAFRWSGRFQSWP